MVMRLREIPASEGSARMPDPADLMDEPSADDGDTAASGTVTDALDTTDASSADDLHLFGEVDELADTMPRRLITSDDLAAGGMSFETTTPPTAAQAQTAPVAGGELATTGAEDEHPGKTFLTMGELPARAALPLPMPGRPLPVDLLLNTAAFGQSRTIDPLSAALDATPALDAAPTIALPSEPTPTATEPVADQVHPDTAAAWVAASDVPVDDLEPAPTDVDTQAVVSDVELPYYTAPAVWAQEMAPATGGREPVLELPDMATEPVPTVVPHAFDQSQPYSAALLQAVEAEPTHSAPDALDAFAILTPAAASLEAVPATVAAPTPVEAPPAPPPAASYYTSSPASETYDAEPTMPLPTMPLYAAPAVPPRPPVVDVSGSSSRVPARYWIHEDPLEDARFQLGLTGTRPVVREAGRPLPKPRRFRRPMRWRSFLVLVVVSVLVAFACGIALSVTVQALTRPPAAPTPIPTHSVAPTTSPSSQK
jgi:hypothetical protein